MNPVVLRAQLAVEVELELVVELLTELDVVLDVEVELEESDDEEVVEVEELLLEENEGTAKQHFADVH